MTDPVDLIVRAAARRLDTETGPGLAAEAEAALAARDSRPVPPRYGDPVALASLIVAIADLAWTVCTDLKKQAVKPSAEVIARTVRVTLHAQGQDPAPDHVVEVVVSEAIRAASGQDLAES